MTARTLKATLLPMKKIILKSNITAEFLTEFFISWDMDGDFFIPNTFLEIDRKMAMEILIKNSDKVINFLNDKDEENLILDLYVDSDSIRWIVSFAM